MAGADDVDLLLQRPAVVAAVLELGVMTLDVEDVLRELRRFGPVRIDVTTERGLPYSCILQVAGEDPEIGRGRSVLHAALACWASTLESFDAYASRGVTALERFLTEADGFHGETP